MTETLSQRNFVDLALRVSSIMTPEELLARSDFAEPKIIRKPHYPHFDSLLQEREEIRHLRLLPAKDRELRAQYNALPNGDLLRTVCGFVSQARFALKKNDFPYRLPDDVDQYILWVRDAEAKRGAIENSIADSLFKSRLAIDDVIIFERPRKTNVPMVHGTIPLVRHLHVWTRKQD